MPFATLLYGLICPLNRLICVARRHFGCGEINGAERAMFRLLKKAWIPLVIVVVVAVASFLVVRIRGYFGHDFNSGQTYAAADDSKPFNPRSSSTRSSARAPRRRQLPGSRRRAADGVDGAPLPWTLSSQHDGTARLPNIVAQGDGDTSVAASPSMTKSRTRTASNGVHAQTFCLVKSA